jgi:acyl-coenzyme A synthetase/AMP-(fatty) acid ligase
MNKLFLLDRNSIRYSDLIDYVNGIHNLSNLSEIELFVLDEIKRITRDYVEDVDDLIIKIKKTNSSISLKTSGTTGKPKIIEHTISSICKNIKVDSKFEDVNWGLSYNKGKMAFYQVLFQSLFNKSTMINLFNYSFDEISNRIEENRVNFLSATPTFYRLLLSNNFVYRRVDQVTIGGEGPSVDLISKIRNQFPNANIRNIYASSESASLLISENDEFTIPEKYKDKIKIKDNTLHIHIDLLGIVEEKLLEGDWYDTQDLIEFIDEKTFKIIGRKNIEINVSGNKINPFKIEDAINSLGYVINSFVYSKKNSVTGNVLCCDVIVKEEVEKSRIKKDLRGQIEKIEMPTIINFVESIEINENMKINRI